MQCASSTIDETGRFSIGSVIGSSSSRNEMYVGERRRQVEKFHSFYNRKLICDEQLSLDSFELIRSLGQGAYGSVFLAHRTETDEYLALKAIQKSELIETNEETSVIFERQCLYALQHPNIVRFITSFKDNDYIYIGSEWLSGGDLYSLMMCQRFTEAQAKFYAAQILMALDYLHECQLVYRDLKAENIVLTSSGYVKLIDLGLAKPSRGFSKTFCGTPHYIAPEVILRRPYTISPDYWAFGILLHEMVTEAAPYDRTRFDSDVFQSEYDDRSISTVLNEASQIIDQPTRHLNMYVRVIHGCSSMILVDLSEECGRLIKGLLEVDPTKRLGCGVRGAIDIMEQRWFSSIDFYRVYRQEYIAPFLPIRKSYLDPRLTDNTHLNLTAKSIDNKAFDEF